MGLLNSLTVRFNADLSPLKVARSDAISSIKDVSDAAKSATSVFRDMSGSINGGRIVTDEDVARAKLTLIESKVAEAREQFLGMRSSLDLGETVTGLPEAEANLTLLEKQAQDAREQLAELGQQAETAGSEVEEGMGRASGGFSGLLGHLKEAGSNFLDFGAKIGQTIFGLQTLGQTAVSMASSLFAPAMQIEETTNSFEVFDGSMKKAQQEMADLSSFAAHTPFETSSIDDAALKMQAVGINAKNVIPDIQALGDALDAGGRVSSADLNMIVDDFDKIQTQGHLTTDVMNSFALQGIDAWTILEKQKGKSRDQLAEMISKGLYPANQAMHDLTTGIEASPLYSGQMANDTNSMTGIMSTLKSNWDQALASFASPIMKDLEPVLNDISTDLASPSFKDFAGSIGQGVASVFGKVADLAKKVNLKTITDDVGKLGDWFQTKLQPAIDQARPGFDQLATTVGKLAQSVLPPLIQDAGDLIPKIVTLAGDIAGGLSSAIDGITSSFDTWSPIVFSVGFTLAAVFTPAIIQAGVQSVIAGAKLTYNFVAGVIQTGIEGWNAAGKLVLFIGNLIATGAQAAWAGIQLAGQFIGNLIATGAQAVIAGAKIVASFIGALIQAGVQAGITAGAFVADLIPSVISFATEAIAAAATAIPAILVGFGAWIVAAATVAVENIIAFWPIYLVILAIVAVVAIVILVIKNWGAIIGWLGDQWNRLVGWVQTQIKIFGLVMQAGAKLFQEAFTNAWNAVTGFFSKAGTWFHDHVWQPVVDAFSRVFGGLRDKAAGIWSSITGGVKAAFNTVIDLINNGISGINNITSKVGIASIPYLPHLSTGGQIPPGGFAIVGDPTSSELVYGGSAGATVFSHSQSAAMLAAAGGSSGRGGGETHVHIYVDSQEIAHYSADSTADLVVKKLFGHGPVRGAA